MDHCCIPTKPEEPPSPSSSHRLCPVSRFPGQRVAWRTVAALTRGRLPARQELWLCRDPTCPTAYFGAEGSLIGSEELRVDPGFKGGSGGLICYCFLHRREDIAREVATTGATGILAAIEDQVRAGNCACEVRNPSGRCCLAEVRQAIRELGDDRSV